MLRQLLRQSSRRRVRSPKLALQYGVPSGDKLMTMKVLGRVLLGIVVIPVVYYFLYTTAYEMVYHYLYGYVIVEFRPPTAFDIWSARVANLMLFLVTPASLILWCIWCYHTRNRQAVHSHIWMMRNMALGLVLIPLVLRAAFILVIVLFALLWRPFGVGGYDVPWWQKNSDLLKAVWMYGIMPSSVLVWCTWCWQKARQS
jgi:hypothetical protein